MQQANASAGMADLLMEGTLDDTSHHIFWDNPAEAMVAVQHVILNIMATFSAEHADELRAELRGDLAIPGNA